MTTIKKINLLSIVLIAATIIGVGLDAGFKWYDYGRDFKEGFSLGWQEAGEQATAFPDFLPGLGIIAICITIAVAFFRLVINYIGILGTVRRGDVFSEDLEWRTNHIGIGLIVIYVAEWLLALILSSDTMECPGFGVLCCGIGLMIVAKIFALGRQVKEEQEYTV